MAKRAKTRKASKAAKASKKGAKARRNAPPRRQVAKRKTAARATASRSSRKRKTSSAAQPSKVAIMARAAAGAVLSVAQRLRWSKNENDPFLLLEADHRRFEQLLKQGEETTSRAVKRRNEILDTLSDTLNLHELIEEKVLYPALKEHPETRAIVLEGFEEHHVADVVVAELHKLAKNNDQWGAKFKVLKESIEHHIQEEEGNMFRVARTILSREELDALGARMRAMKT